MRRFRVALSAVVLTVGLLPFWTATALAGPGDLVVDNDMVECPKANFTSIQAAVTAAQPGAKITVCPGTYVEQVTIPVGKDGLRLQSKKKLQAVIAAPPVMTPPLAVMRVRGAQDVEIRGFTITGPGSGGCDSADAGVLVDEGGAATIRENHITAIRDTPLGGCQNGVGIQVGAYNGGSPTPGMADIRDNLIDEYQKGGIVANEEGTVVRIEKNRIVGAGPTGIIAQNGIQVGYYAQGLVKNNEVSGNWYTGAGWTSAGILLYALPDGGVRVENNETYANDIGISLGGDEWSPPDGGPTVGTEIRNNRSHDNRVDGIAADAYTADNLIRNNKLENNGEHDCHDDSVGGGSGGSANTWQNNRGDTQNRPGLCKDAAVTAPVF